MFNKERELKELRKAKIALHEKWKKCEKAGDRVGMQRELRAIRVIDKKILGVMDSK